jgi:hypothetical protein
LTEPFVKLLCQIFKVPIIPDNTINYYNITLPCTHFWEFTYNTFAILHYQNFIYSTFPILDYNNTTLPTLPRVSTVLMMSNGPPKFEIILIHNILHIFEILELIFHSSNKSWKNYWSVQSFTGQKHRESKWFHKCPAVFF